mmetsp:Transcript_57957/g.127043  ORF Transcript_57957/g.127043 Transcript_57957/m.127043 type:complete len:220 (+) Transcript_57957:575-1234(+)
MHCLRELHRIDGKCHSQAASQPLLVFCQDRFPQESDRNAHHCSDHVAADNIARLREGRKWFGIGQDRCGTEASDQHYKIRIFNARSIEIQNSKHANAYKGADEGPQHVVIARSGGTVLARHTLPLQQIVSKCLDRASRPGLHQLLHRHLLLEAGILDIWIGSLSQSQSSPCFQINTVNIPSCNQVLVGAGISIIVLRKCNNGHLMKLLRRHWDKKEHEC